MTILIVSAKFAPVIGGGETYSLNQALRLLELGHEVAVVTSPHPDRNLSDFPFKIFEVEGLKEEALDIYSVTPKLHTVIEEINPDIIHVHNYFSLLAVGLARTNKKQQIVGSIHSTPIWEERIFGDFEDFNAELTFCRNTLQICRPKALIVGSPAYAEAAKKTVDGKYEIIVSTYPVDIEFMNSGNRNLRHALGVRDNNILITVPSRIVERKGIFEAILSLEYLPEEYMLYLPGAYDPADKKFWTNITESKAWQKMQDRIVIPEKRINYQDLPDVYAVSDIMAMPSYYEGFGVAGLESMAAGKPLIGAEVQGLNKLIISEQNGLFIPPKDVKAISDAILKIQSSPSLKAKLVEGGRATANGYSWDKHIEQLLELYQQ